MASYKTCGIIIKRANFNEADRLITIFTKDKGKIKVIAKGARKQASKLGGHLELFCLTNLVIAEGRNLDIVTEAEIIESHPNIRKDLQATNQAYYLAEVIDKLTIDEEPHPDIFQLAKDALAHIEKDPEDLLLPFFEINILKAIGYEPELAHCLKCHEPARPVGNKFDLEEGGLVCDNCSSIAGDISPEAIKVLRLSLKGDISLLKRLKINKNLSREVGSLVKSFIQHIYQGEFKSRRFVNE